MRIDVWAPAPIYGPDDKPSGLTYIKNPLTYYLLRRLKQGRNTMMAATGDPRSGKSNTISCIGEECSVSHPFKAKDVTLEPLVYMHALANGRPGDFVQFDEPAAEYNNRDFATAKNKMLNATHVTFGSKYINVGWALPVFQTTDLGARMLCKLVFEHPGEGRRGIVWFYKNWVNHYTGKTGRTKQGSILFGKAWQDRPEEEKEYLEIKRNYQDKKYAGIIRDFAASDDLFKSKAEDRTTRIKAAVAEVLKNPTRYYNDKGRIVARTITKEIGQQFGLKGNDPYDVVDEVMATLKLQKQGKL